MEAKDFIIGGWYYHKEKNLDGSPRICAEKVDLGIIKCILDYTNEYFEAKDYNPIPISEDILEKNGFEIVYSSDISKSYCLYDYYEDGTEKFRIEVKLYQYTPNTCFIDIEHDDIGSVRLKFSFVHELQHALRICGLGEMADNFKI